MHVTSIYPCKKFSKRLYECIADHTLNQLSTT